MMYVINAAGVSIAVHSLFFFIFKNGPSPASFSFIFGLFQTNINTILQQINVKKCPSSITALGFEPTTFRM